MSTVKEVRPKIAPRVKNGPTRFVARQPIFDRAESVFAYELLFRDGLKEFSQFTDADLAARQTMDSSLLMGLEVLCSGRRAFVNCTAETLTGGYMELFPPAITVVEVLESVVEDDAVFNACVGLKERGYLIALDDFADNGSRKRLLDVADILKVDLRAVSLTDCVTLIHKYSSKMRLLAEKVETRREFVCARDMGFSYFQGYFFHHPVVVSMREIPPQQLSCLRIMQAVQQPEPDFREIEKGIKADVSLCYRLLRYLNSPLFGFSNEIHSVRHAMAVLGLRELRRWVSLVATLGAAEGRCSEQVMTALVRARFCELLAGRLPGVQRDLFLMGLLSLMDAILEMPLTDVLEQLPVEFEIKSALLGRPSDVRPVYRLMLAQECGEWQGVKELAKELKLTEKFISESYWQALEWARQVSVG